MDRYKVKLNTLQEMLYSYWVKVDEECIQMLPHNRCTHVGGKVMGRHEYMELEFDDRDRTRMLIKKEYLNKQFIKS